MRNAFIEQLTTLAQDDPNQFLITADLGFGVLTEFEKQFPKQYLNAGVAEQNMTTLATGLAMEGRKVFTYSIGNFPTLRCLEQIRNDVCYHELDVRVVSVGGGFSYGALGMSHHATEDVAIMRSLPKMTVVTPCSRWETREVMRHIVDHEGPLYLRLERSGDDIPTGEGPFEFGKARVLRSGTNIALLTYGSIVTEVLGAADILRGLGVHASVTSFHTIKPLDEQAVYEASRAGAILTVEEHSVIGGIGSAVAETCLDHGWSPRFARLGMMDTYSSVVGSQEHLRRHYGLDAATIAKRAMDLLSEATR